MSVEDIESSDLHLFFFSDPEVLDSKIPESNDTKVVEIVDNYLKVNNVNDSITPHDVMASMPHKMETENIAHIFSKTNPMSNDIVETEMTEKLKDKIIFTFSSPDSVVIDKDNINTKIEKPKAHNGCNNKCKSGASKSLVAKDKSLNDIGGDNCLAMPCKVCWIFKHLNKCEICGKINDSLHISNAPDSSKISIEADNLDKQLSACNYCWIFKHLEKCETCGKSNKPQHCQNESETLGDAQIKACSISENETKNIQKDVKKDTAKEQTWQCNICLTYNRKEKEICDCCDANPILNTAKSKIKNFNFDIRFNIPFMSNKDDIQEAVLPGQYFDSKVSGNKIENDIQQKETKDISLENKGVTKGTSSFVDNETCNNANIINVHEEVSLMDFEIIKQENCHDLVVTKNIVQYSFLDSDEAMDVEIPDERMILLNSDVNMSNNITDLPNINTNANSFVAVETLELDKFQFNVGSTVRTQKPKKRMRKFR